MAKEKKMMINIMRRCLQIKDIFWSALPTSLPLLASLDPILSPNIILTPSTQLNAFYVI